MGNAFSLQRARCDEVCRSHRTRQGRSSACLLDGEIRPQVGLPIPSECCHLSCCRLHPTWGRSRISQGILKTMDFENSMHRSPITSFVLLLSGVLCWAQNNPATPKPGTGMPPTPVTGTRPSTPAPQQPQQAPQGVTESPTPFPSPTPASGAQPSAQPSPSQPSPAGQQQSGASGNTGATAGASSGTQPTADQQKFGRRRSGADQLQNAPATPPPPAQPKTEILDSSATSGALSTDGHDPILDPPPVPQTPTTLVGGTISSVDRMRNRMTVQVFGGGHWDVNFDERTHIFHNGAETTQL